MSTLGKLGKKVLKAHKPGNMAKLGFKAATNPAGLAGKLIGGKVGKTISKIGKYAGPLGAVYGLKKLLKKNNTNVTKSSKYKRRERIDKREEGKRTEAQQALIDKRREKIDAKDTARFATNEKARTRVNKQISRQNERLGRNDPLYKSQEEIDRDAMRRKGAPGGRRGQGGTRRRGQRS